MTRAVELLMKWVGSDKSREWVICSAPGEPEQIYIEVTEGAAHVRRYFAASLITSAQIDVLQMEAAAAIERLKYGLSSTK